MSKKMSRIMTPTQKKQFTQEWNKLYPTLGYYKPTRLLRRVGPLLIGICLDTDSENLSYRPIAHIHSLCSPVDFVSLTFWHQPVDDSDGRNRLLYIRTRLHELEYRKTAEFMRRQAWVPLEGSLSFEDIVDCYVNYWNPIHPANYQNDQDFTELVQMAIWSGEKKRALEIIDIACETILTWRESMLECVGGVKKLRSDLLEAISDPDAIRAQVESNAKLFKLEKVPYEDFAETSQLNI